MQASSSRPVMAQAIPIVDRLGFFSAGAAAVLSAAFGIGVIVTLLVFPKTTWNGDIRAYAASYNALAMAVAVVPSILLAPSFLGLVVAVHGVAPAEKRPLTLLALAFATLYVATVGINYFLQLTVVRQNLTSGQTEAMALFAMGNPQSVFWALEILGYFWQGAAALLLATCFAGSGLERWTRWLLTAVFVTGALGVVAAVRGFHSFSDPLFAVGGGAWSLAFPAAMILCAAYFRRQSVRSSASRTSDSSI
jgi:hypothetical protein